MKYYRNIDLATHYSVAEGTIRHLIKNALSKKNALQLYEHNGRHFIASIESNRMLLDEIMEQRDKSSRWRKDIVPTEEFYKIYTKPEIIDIVSSMQLYREIPLQYGYIGKGAEAWDGYAKKLLEDENNTLQATIELLRTNFENLKLQIEPGTKINIVDLGQGNCLPVKEFLSKILDDYKLNRYIGIDISQEMLDIAKQNIQEWYGDKVTFEGYRRDFTSQRFDDLLADEESGTINLVLMLGGTGVNFREPGEVVKFISRSLGLDDLFLTSKKLDSAATRRYFNFHSTDRQIQELPEFHSNIPSNLNIDPSLFDVLQGYDNVKKSRFIKITFKSPVKITFNIGNREVFFPRGDSLLLWQARHYDKIDDITELEHNHFSVLVSAVTKNQQFSLCISKRKTES